jgi:ferredoxin
MECVKICPEHAIRIRPADYRPGREASA